MYDNYHRIFAERSIGKFQFNQDGKYLEPKKIQLLLTEGVELLFMFLIFVIITLAGSINFMVDLLEKLSQLLKFLKPVLQILNYFITFLVVISIIKIKSSKFELLKKAVFKPYGLALKRYYIQQDQILLQYFFVALVSVYIMCLQFKKIIQYSFRQQTRSDFNNCKSSIIISFIIALLIPYEISGPSLIVIDYVRIFRKISSTDSTIEIDKQSMTPVKD